MPVPSYPGANSYTANGITTVFPYSFRILDEEDLQVTVDDVLKVLGTDYTVDGVDEAGGGDVTFLAAPANGTAVVIDRVRAYERETDYQRNGAFDEETVDKDFDSLTMMAQQLEAMAKRAVKAPRSVTDDLVLSAASWAMRHGKMIGFDSVTGELGVFTLSSPGALVVSGYIETLLDDANVDAALATLEAEKRGEAAAINVYTDNQTLALVDKGAIVEMNKATAVNLTVPTNATIPFPVKTRIDVVQYGAGQVTVVAAGGVTIRSAGGALKLVGQYSGASLYKRGADEWVLVGDITT